MSKESVMAALRKAREAREGNIFGGTGQAEFNKNFYAGRATKTDGVSKTDSNEPMDQKAFNARFYAGKS
ncbi:MAG: hypothetical protein E6750_14380 [Atlantibacter hermannii]|uniref:hypothetical protein n=1 Tax=Atlantibacter hermannii TaxID=565 RepID=UPI002904A02A|nr:hypothetical protein [Atlantibacter hermannii]MDU1952577.1 hypothetical protein [Atlantibacter hermannii]